jgi:hypothetical protein
MFESDHGLSKFTTAVRYQIWPEFTSTNANMQRYQSEFETRNLEEKVAIALCQSNKVAAEAMISYHTAHFSTLRGPEINEKMQEVRQCRRIEQKQTKTNSTMKIDFEHS